MKLTIINDAVFPRFPDEQLEMLNKEAPDLIVDFVRADTVGVADLIDSEIVFGWAPPRFLKDLPNLKWLHLPSAGANAFTDASLYANPSVILTKSSGTFGIPISEYVLGTMIALSRNFTGYYKSQQEGSWNRGEKEALEVFGSNVLVLGLGNIGSEVCTRLMGFSCRITGFRRDPSVPHELVSDVRSLSKLRDCLPNADYIIICLPGTAETGKLIGREELDLMKNSAILINIGRGSVIDTDALVEALNNKKIAGAGLDVTDPEPLPAGHPLWSASNAIITPHVSASSPGNSQRRLSIFIDLLKRYRSGLHMFNEVDLSAGY